MPSYYAAILDKESGRVMIHPSGPFDTYDKAMAVHRQALWSITPTVRYLESGRLVSPAEDSVDRRVLVDLATVSAADREQWESMMLHDPVLHAVFERGRQQGALECIQTTKT